MPHTLLSVNINKYALLRNSRGRQVPDILHAADSCIAAGAHGITVHPRLDQRHIRFDDVPRLSAHLLENHPNIELNVECQAHPSLIDLVLQVRPAQCTMVPVSPGEITSDNGYDLPDESAILAPLSEKLRKAGIRVSIFMDCEPSAMAHVPATGVDRVELYTGPFAWAWGTPDQERETNRVLQSVIACQEWGIDVNAGHDLDRHNLIALRDVPGLREVSIGHAQICRALEVGTTQSVQELLAALGWR